MPITSSTAAGSSRAGTTSPDNSQNSGQTLRERSGEEHRIETRRVSAAGAVTMASDYLRTVIAAGTESRALCADMGIELPVESSPATLSRFAGPRGLVGRVVSGPDLEIRQDAAGRLFVCDYYVEGETLDERAADTLALVRRRFRGADTVTSIDARVGWRPMPADGMPIVGFTPDAPGLYLAVMHGGVVMAPVVGRLATDEIVAGNEAEALAPCRVSRFG